MFSKLKALYFKVKCKKITYKMFYGTYFEPTVMLNDELF